MFGLLATDLAQTCVFNPKVLYRSMAVVHFYDSQTLKTSLGSMLTMMSCIRPDRASMYADTGSWLIIRQPRKAQHTMWLNGKLFSLLWWHLLQLSQLNHREHSTCILAFLQSGLDWCQVYGLCIFFQKPFASQSLMMSFLYDVAHLNPLIQPPNVTLGSLYFRDPSLNRLETFCW